MDPVMQQKIIETAKRLGIDPRVLATIISYETGGTMDPTKEGPTTKWGTHKGLIQFGEPQAKQYGVDWSNPMASQLGAGGAIEKYMKDRGVTPGMGLLDVYSAVNAGAPGLYNRSDAGAGGAAGTVRDKVTNQMGSHWDKFEGKFGPTYSQEERNQAMATVMPQDGPQGQPAQTPQFSPMQDLMGDDGQIGRKGGLLDTIGFDGTFGREGGLIEKFAGKPVKPEESYHPGMGPTPQMAGYNRTGGLLDRLTQMFRGY